jgi:hypothetical protein
MFLSACSGMDDGLTADEMVEQEMRGLPDDLKAA